MIWDDGLTGTARQIAETDESPLRVMAGPGTGKSFALKRRVARLLESGQDPRRILAVTFTRTAAADLVEDLKNLGIANCDQITAGTLHGFCFGLLSSEEVFDYVGRVPRPVVTFLKSGVLQFEGGVMLDDLVGMGAFGTKRDCTTRLKAFEAAWARLQSQEPGWPVDPVDQSFQEALTSWLRFHGAIILGELVPETLRFLRNNPASSVRSAFDHVIVDEYQDLNKAEQVLVDILAQNGSLVLVGDVDQSIYRFRHAHPEGIRDFGQHYPQTYDATLHQCRRCPTNVVAIADHLIRHNHTGSVAPRLRPHPGNPPGEVHVVQWTDVDEEAAGLATFIESLIKSQRYLPGDVLVLSPRRLLGYKIRDCLRAICVPVHSFYPEEALESPTAQRAFGLLRLLADSEDRVALRWWLAVGSPSGRKREYQHLRQYCEQSGMSPREVLEAVTQGSLQLRGIKELEGRYRELVVELEQLKTLSLVELVDRLLPDATEECTALRELAILALPDAEDVIDLFDRVRGHITQPEMPKEGDFVRVMSLHKSKGLTSPVTIVASCIQGLIPFQDDKAPQNEQGAILEEQRRLFYVAITRCTQMLVISSAVRMERDLAFKVGAKLQSHRYRVSNTIASQFLDELGPNAPRPRRGTEWAESGYAP